MYRKSDNLFIYFKITKFISSCFDKESILLSHLLHIVLAICKFADAIDVPGTINSFIFSILSVNYIHLKPLFSFVSHLFQIHGEIFLSDLPFP